MLNINEFNTVAKSPFKSFDGDKFRFADKKTLAYNQPFLLHAVYIAKGKFGFQTVYVVSTMSNVDNGFRVSMNGRETADKILASAEFIDAVNKGTITVTFEKFHSKKWNKDCLAVQFDMLEQPAFDATSAMR